jgi:hypothetical protein
LGVIILLINKPDMPSVMALRLIILLTLFDEDGEFSPKDSSCPCPKFAVAAQTEKVSNADIFLMLIVTFQFIKPL